MTLWLAQDEETAAGLRRRGQEVRLQSTDVPWFEAETIVVAPANEPGEALVISIKRSSKHYVATGMLGLDELVEEEPERPKSWWRKVFLD